jgi:hypothetical protein
MINSNLIRWSKLVILLIVTYSCSVNKDIVLVNNLPDDKVIIVGTLEYDYSQLKSKNIRGVDLYLVSEEKAEDFKLPGKYLPKGSYKYFQFLSKTGKKGNFELYCKPREVYSETNNLLNLMNMERSMYSPEKKVLEKYIFNDCKIVNLGKITVHYSGGNTMDGKISYSYTFSTLYEDTTALHAFRESFPKAYDNCKNEICTFRSELESCINYILRSISEEKALIIKKYIDENPARAKTIFHDLTAETQKAIAEKIEKFNSEELNNFLNDKK